MSKANQKAESRMGYAYMRMRNNRSKIRWDLAGHVSPEFKPGNNRSLGSRVAQLRARSEQIGSG